ncbi:type II secretion system protein [Companilactobacillus baiquanensis]|uniref:Prepilin-type N-terminal cleavage/methylation domain-containing protein n=1 Tax=Companilactobacillus baiquanensis TaxID=2486005 RepID=A0ABW1UVI4_9LACO|nr:type II secretion system protein [Companilactobacillus baiquanensis]
MVKLLKSRRFGFTLAESVIVLAIFCILILATNLGVKDYQSKIAERQSMQQFKNLFKNTLNEAFLSGKDYNIVISSDSNSVVFKSNENNVFFARLKFPNTIKYFKNESTIQVRRTGLIRPQTIKFYSNLTNHNYIYVIQMNWGEIIEKNT